MSDRPRDMDPLGALGGTTPRVDRVGPYTLTETLDVALASVAARRAQEARCHAQLSALLGDVPAPGGAVSSRDWSGFWLGPESWMLSAALSPDGDIAADLQARFDGSASITEQTDAWAIFDLGGEGLDKVMELLCPIDMRRMQASSAQRTAIDHMGCIVIASAPLSFLRILGPRSYAGSLHHALLTAMRAV